MFIKKILKQNNMTKDSLKSIKILTRVKINEGYYKDKLGTFKEYNDKHVFIDIGTDVVLFPIDFFLENIKII